MTLAPRIALAVAIIAIGGATGGAVIGSRIGEADILPRGSVGTDRPYYDFQAEYDAGSRSRNTERPPDRYAIETPEGRFEIGELRERGLGRNRRLSAYDVALAAEDRAWDKHIAEFERGDWEPDSRFADSEWTKAGGSGFERDAVGATVTRTAPSGARRVETAASSVETPSQDATPPAIGPDQVKPLDLPAPVTLPAPAAN